MVDKKDAEMAVTWEVNMAEERGGKKAVMMDETMVF